MKKLLCLILSVIAMTLCVTACGSESPAKTSDGASGQTITSGSGNGQSATNPSDDENSSDDTQFASGRVVKPIENGGQYDYD